MPAGAWLGLHYGWRATFWAVAAIGVVATVVIAHGAGLPALTRIGALVPASALLVALYALRRERADDAVAAFVDAA